MQGSGSDTDPYKIGSLDDWKAFVAMNNNDENLGAGKYFELTSDITIAGTYTSLQDSNQMMAFNEQIVRGFGGTLDGRGYTLTFNYTKSVGSESIAPFLYLHNAVIKNLKVAGTISTNKNCAGGIAYLSMGNSTIENCTVSATINSSINGAGWHGGFVGRNTDTLTFKDCVFNGSLLGPSTSSCGGFVGRNAPPTDDGSSSVSFTDCLFAPAEVTVTRSATFSYDWNGGTSTFTRAYYTYGDGYANQGTRVYATAPNDRFTKKITAADNNQYWAEGSANITGLLPAYAQSEANSRTYSVEFDGETLTSGTDYTASITKDGQAVTTITETGTYTLTITGTGNYAGSISRNFEVFSAVSVPYIDADGQLQHNPAEEYSATSTLQGDWWYVTGETTIGGRIGISGTKYLILCDGATLTLPKGIHLTDGNTLNIYGQSAGTGKLIINGVASQQAGIGGNNGEQCGTLTVNGGEIEVTGGNDGGAGIGGGMKGSGGTITVNGGKVTAKGTGNFSPNGIGGGTTSYAGQTGGNGGTITINGGIVSADGMGGGHNNNSGTVSLNWKNPTDRIYSSSYNSNVTLSGQFVLEETGAPATTENIGGKTLVPALTVSFDANGGSGTMDSVLKGASMDYVLPACSFTAPADKEFDCWEIDGTQHNAGGTITMNGNITLKALWRNVSRTVTFDANGHGTAPAAQSVEYGMTASEPEAPQAEGYTFGGWYREAGCTNAWDFDEAVTSDVTLYAKWTAVDYTIGYDLAGGSVSPANPTSYTADTESFTLTNPTRTGYDFAGWTGTGLSGAQETVTIAKGTTGDRSYTATWTAHSYSITYDTAGGNVSPANPKSYTIESPDFTLNNPARNAYTFTGWTGSNGDTPQTTVTITKGNTGDKTYTAHWKAVAYTISYDLGGGTLPDGYRVSYDIESDTFTLPKPEREGYEFGGWTLSGDNAPASTDLTVPTGSTDNREYIAHWDIIRYTLSYDLAGGTATNPKTYTIESGDFTLANPAKAGQKFAGWTGTDLAGATMSVTITQGSTGNRTYTATWGDYTNKYYVRTPDDLNIIQAGWNYPAGIITASADKEDFDPSKKLVITANSANGWALRDTIFWHFNGDTVPYILKNAITDTASTTTWEISCADITKDGGITITFGAYVSDFSTKRPGSYDDDVTFSVEVK